MAEWFAHFHKLVETGEKKQRTLDDYTRQARRVILPTIGAMRVVDVEKVDVRRVIAKVGGAGTQKNRVRACVSSFLSWCEDDEAGVNYRPEGSNPCRTLKPKKKKQRENKMSVGQQPAFHAALDLAANQTAADALRLMMVTGLRGERGAVAPVGLHRPRRCDDHAPGIEDRPEHQTDHAGGRDVPPQQEREHRLRLRGCRLWLADWWQGARRHIPGSVQGGRHRRTQGARPGAGPSHPMPSPQACHCSPSSTLSATPTSRWSRRSTSKLRRVRSAVTSWPASLSTAPRDRGGRWSTSRNVAEPDPFRDIEVMSPPAWRAFYGHTDSFAMGIGCELMTSIVEAPTPKDPKE